MGSENPAPARLLVDFWGCSGLGEYDVFWLGVVVGGGGVGGSGGSGVLLVGVAARAVDRWRSEHLC